LEEYLASKILHIINKESERFTLHNSRGSSNIDLIITNNIIAAVNEWEMSAEESLSDHNYLKQNIGVGAANSHINDNKCQGIKYIIKEHKLYVFKRKLVQEMWKMAYNKCIEGGAKELDKYLFTTITTENDLEQHVDVCRRSKISIQEQTQGRRTAVPGWTESLTLMRKRVCTCRILYLRTRNDEVLRESRKQKYVEVKTVSSGNQEGET